MLSALLEGLSLPDTAARYQISVNTVRWHLKRLFEKTNTNRQSDQIRVASAAIPPIRATRALLVWVVAISVVGGWFQKWRVMAYQSVGGNRQLEMQFESLLRAPPPRQHQAFKHPVI